LSSCIDSRDYKLLLFIPKKLFLDFLLFSLFLSLLSDLIHSIKDYQCSTNLTPMGYKETKMETNYQKFTTARSIVEDIKRTVTGENPFQVPLTDEYFSFDFPNAWQRLCIVFRPTQDGRMMIRTFNRKCEDEVHFIITKEAARKICRKALDGGFLPDPPEATI